MIKGKAEAAFGTGDIRTTTLLCGGVGVYVFDNQLPHKIGEKTPVDPGYSLRGKDIMLTFTRVESVDVLISDLQEIKRLMVEGADEGYVEAKTSIPDFWKK